jgi:hypothetical protein
MFSSISPDAEVNLKNELFNCFKYIGIPFNELYKMPTRDRKFYIKRYNDYVDNMNSQYEGNQTTYNGDISAYTDIEQKNNQLFGVSR